MRRALTPALSLGEIVASLGGSLQGDAAVEVDRLCSLRNADERSISFLVRRQQREAAIASRAIAYIVSPALAPEQMERAVHFAGALVSCSGRQLGTEDTEACGPFAVRGAVQHGVDVI